VSTTLTVQSNNSSTRTDSTGTSSTTDSDNSQLGLSDTSTPAVTKSGKALVTLGGGGTATLDLTAVPTLDGRTVDLTGLKVRTWKLTAVSTNTHDLTAAKGAANGHTGFGASYSEVVHAGGFSGPRYDGGNGVAVAAGNKTIDFSGTAGEGVYVSFSAGA
jgi:hypothetical protein